MFYRLANKLLRLSKFLSQQGICSRREAEFFIQQGWLKVNGTTVSEPGTKVSENCHVVLDPRAQEYQSRLLTVLIHKPIGYVSSQAEKGYRPAASLITRSNLIHRADHSAKRRLKFPISGLAPAGRLDIDSSGLLVLTQDGRIASRLISPSSDVEKEYLVRVNSDVQPGQVKRLCSGLSLDNVVLAPARVEMLDRNYFRMILTEGRKRQIRRMCQLLGLEVKGLKRVRIGKVRLGSLPVGKWRLLHREEEF